MTARTGQDVEVWQGEHITLRFTVESSETLDLQTAESILWRVDDGEVKTLVDGVTVVDATTVDVALTAASTSRGPRRYKHELRVIDVEGRPVTLAVGDMRVHRSLHA